MAKSYYKHSNGRIQMRGGGGRFRRSTLADIGMGVCPTPGCRHLTRSFYDGDENEEFLDPRKFRQRCYTCEPHTPEEIEVKRVATEAAKGRKSGFELMLESAAKTMEMEDERALLFKDETTTK